MGRESVEDAGKTGQSPDFGIQLRIQSAIKELPLASDRYIPEASSTPVTAVFYV
jgi:hypothetical protein